MQFDRGDLRHGDQSVRIVDYKIGLPIGLTLADHRRQRAVAVLLEEAFAANRFRTTHNCERPTRQPGQCMIANRVPIPPDHAW
jgi:hypothetical protein